MGSQRKFPSEIKNIQQFRDGLAGSAFKLVDRGSNIGRRHLGLNEEEEEEENTNRIIRRRKKNKMKRKNKNKKNKL